jgi:TDG/mug DNA glycosylase family protein
MPLPDLLAHNLNVVFVGTAVTSSSEAASAYYATHGNRFYEILHAVGITQNLVEPQNYRNLLHEGIGLTDLVKTRVALDNNLELEDFDINGFNQKMEEFTPRIICFNGKLAASHFLLGKKKTSIVNYGLQAQEEGSQISVFVAPSTSRTANKFWNPFFYEQLAELINNLP